MNINALKESKNHILYFNFDDEQMTKRAYKLFDKHLTSGRSEVPIFSSNSYLALTIN